MIRERTVRAFSVLLVVAGSGALVVTAGAQWSNPSAARTVTVAARSHANAAASDDPTLHAATRVQPRATAKPAKATVAHLTLPKSLPATMLPAGTTLPTIAPPPTNPWASRQPTRLGRIEVPAIGLDQPFFDGVDQAAFKNGVGHWPGSPDPGGWGNAVFGGHRTTEAHPFLNMDRLRAGEQINFVMTNGWTYVYTVTNVFVVPQTALYITDQKPGRTVTLFTCNPKGSSSQRLVTTGVLRQILAPT
jgi:LPXTG-site transpeptidase (sortase) family protein